MISVLLYLHNFVDEKSSCSSSTNNTAHFDKVVTKVELQLREQLYKYHPPLHLEAVWKVRTPTYDNRTFM